MRAGIAILPQLIPSDQTLLSMVAPAVTRKHLTLGATWRVAERWELTASYLHGFRETVAGMNSIPPGFPPGGVGGGEANLRMKQDSLGVSLGWRM